VITIVSGLPRSGTSLMMQMLGAGGMTLLTDFERKPDDDNPRGYCEWEPAKLLPRQPNLIDAAEGKAVKVISQLLLFLPEGRSYKVIFMERPLAEVLASQQEMLKRRGTTAGALSDDAMAAHLTSHLKDVQARMNKRMPICSVAYPKLVSDPMTVAQTVRDFLELDLDVHSMTLRVDPSLYRNRRSGIG
jgi:hypothetical protein